MVAIEIRSPNVETDETLDVYGRVGVSERVVIDRVSNAAERFVNRVGRLSRATSDVDGWVVVDGLPLRLRLVDGRPEVEPVSGP